MKVQRLQLKLLEPLRKYQGYFTGWLPFTDAKKRGRLGKSRPSFVREGALSDLRKGDGAHRIRTGDPSMHILARALMRHLRNMTFLPSRHRNTQYMYPQPLCYIHRNINTSHS